MTIYLHRFSGILPAGDIYSTGWHSNSGLPLVSSHANAVTWANEVWTGTIPIPGIATFQALGSTLTKVTTYALQGFFPFNAVGVLETDVSIDGSSGGQPLPQDLAIVASLRTDDPSRKGRGRMYLPVCDNGGLTNQGELATGYLNGYLNALQNGWSIVNALGERPVIFSRSTGVFQDVTRFGVGHIFDRQSRRVNKVNQVRTFDAMP